MPIVEYPASGGGGGSGDVIGPAGATDNAIARFDTTTGKLIQNSTVTVSDAGAVEAPLGTNALPSYSFAGDLNTGIYSPAADQVGIACAGVQRIGITTTAFVPAIQLQAQAGAVGSPSYSFAGDTDTGVYSSGANSLVLVTGGGARITCSTTAITLANPIVLGAGSVTAPSYTFSGDLNCGMYSGGADIIRFATNGAMRLQISNSLFGVGATSSFAGELFRVVGAGRFDSNLSVAGYIQANGADGTGGTLDVMVQDPIGLGSEKTRVCIRGNAGEDLLLFGNDTNLGAIQGATFDFGAFQDILIQPQGGNVGIGITGASPSAMLEVAGGTMLNGGIGFFGVGPQGQQTSGANLTNNVTAGGTNDTIANYTDLTVYLNDAAAIRNNIYQLARKLKQVNDALRVYGILT